MAIGFVREGGPFTETRWEKVRAEAPALYGMQWGPFSSLYSQLLVRGSTIVVGNLTNLARNTLPK